MMHSSEVGLLIPAGGARGYAEFCRVANASLMWQMYIQCMICHDNQHMT